MSQTLILTERSNGLSLKNPLASKIEDRFGSVIDLDGIDYLSGLLDATTDKGDHKVLSKLINRLQEGAIFDIRSEF